jgi:hypothetical protein
MASGRDFIISGRELMASGREQGGAWGTIAQKGERAMIRRTGAVALAAILAASAYATIGADQESGQAQAPQTVRMAPPAVDVAEGPYIADPSVVTLLDRSDPGGDCTKSGPLVFGCLIQALSMAEAHEPPIGALANPFNLKVAQDIRETIEQDLAGFQTSGGIEPSQQIHPAFLTNEGSRMELVGIVNRIDRQFIHDLVPGDEDHRRCGEISLIYRFSYSLRDGAVSSRLPVTMNVVLPAIPAIRPWASRPAARSRRGGWRNCAGRGTGCHNRWWRTSRTRKPASSARSAAGTSNGSS